MKNNQDKRINCSFFTNIIFPFLQIYPHHFHARIHWLFKYPFFIGKFVGKKMTNIQFNPPHPPSRRWPATKSKRTMRYWKRNQNYLWSIDFLILRIFAKMVRKSLILRNSWFMENYFSPISYISLSNFLYIIHQSSKVWL